MAKLCHRNGWLKFRNNVKDTLACIVTPASPSTSTTTYDRTPSRCTSPSRSFTSRRPAARRRPRASSGRSTTASQPLKMLPLSAALPLSRSALRSLPAPGPRFCCRPNKFNRSYLLLQARTPAIKLSPTGERRMPAWFCTTPHTIIHALWTNVW